MGGAVFTGEVAFEKTPVFNRDTAGFAVIEEGNRRVEVRFDTAYTVQPVVSVSLTNDESILLTDDASQELKSDIAAVEEDFAAAVFATDLRYMVTEKSERGFTILLSQDAPRDLQFSWVALAVNDSVTTRSKEREDERDGDAREDTATESLPPTPAVEPLPEPVLPVVDETLPTTEENAPPMVSDGVL